MHILKNLSCNLFKMLIFIFNIGMVYPAVEKIDLDVILYDDLLNNDSCALQKLNKALFEKGIFGIRGIPTYKEKLDRFIVAAKAFNSLPEEVKDLYTFDKTNKGYFDGVVKEANQNIENVVDQMMKMERTSYTPEGSKKLAAYIKEHNVDIRRVYIKVLESNVSNKDFGAFDNKYLPGLSLKTFKFLVDRGYGKYVNVDALIADWIRSLKSQDKNLSLSFQQELKDGLWAKISYLVEKNQKYNLLITAYDPNDMRGDGLLEKISFKDMVKIIELCKNPAAILKHPRFFYELAGKENLMKYLNENKNKLEITDDIYSKLTHFADSNYFRAYKEVKEWVDLNYKQKFGSIEKRTPNRKVELNVEKADKKELNFSDEDMDQRWVAREAAPIKI